MPTVSDLVDLGWNLRIYISVKLPGAADVAGPGTTPGLRALANEICPEQWSFDGTRGYMTVATHPPNESSCKGTSKGNSGKEKRPLYCLGLYSKPQAERSMNFPGRRWRL